MTRRLSLLAMTALLPACDGLDLPFLGGGEAPEEKVVVAPPAPLDLYITSANVNMITVKDGDVEVPAKFEQVDGTFTFDDGDAQQGLAGGLTIALDSWSSGLAVRDERVQTIFFNVEANPTATFTLDRIDGLPEDGLAVGHDAEGTAVGKVYLGSANADIEAKVKLSRTGEGDYHIDTLEPFTVSIESLGLTGPLKELMTICEHESIADGVAVSARIDLSTEKPAEEAKPAKPVNKDTLREELKGKDKGKAKLRGTLKGKGKRAGWKSQ